VDALPRYVRFESPEGESTLSLEHTTERGTGPCPVVYFECARLDETVERLVAAGIQFDSLPLRDPAGNPWCLYSTGSDDRYPPWPVE
jgi:hypothetical protein